MRKISSVKILAVLFLCLLQFKASYAQTSLGDIALKTQIEHSDAVIEGKVIAQRSIWSDDHQFIYTVNTIQVNKVFKGKPINTIEVITLGGTVGLTALVVHHGLKLSTGDIGVFTLDSSDLGQSQLKKASVSSFRVHSMSQGFYKYNFKEDRVANTSFNVAGIEGAFYKSIEKYTQKAPVNLNTFKVNDMLSRTTQSKRALVPGAITLNTSTVRAGIKEQLIITGTSFGLTQGKVWFRNSDDGGSTFISALDSEVLSWTDTQIIVQVPSGAGTGSIFVEDAVTPIAGQSPLSSVLTVSSAEINVQSDAGGGPLQAYQVQHIDNNGSGGFTWELFTDFFNETESGVTTGYREAFTRALDKWTCETGINWSINSTATTADSAGSATDGINVVRFDNGSELDSGTLGVCYSWYTGCNSSSGVNWFASESDLVFNDDFSWYSGTGTPGPGQVDLESIALHELGHAHQLGHIIDPNNGSVGNNAEDIMHYAFDIGEYQRVISANNSIAANAIHSRSTSNAVCSRGLMTSASCALGVDEEESLMGEVMIYPNPSNGEVFINNDTRSSLKSVMLFDLSGRLIKVFNTSSESRVQRLAMSGLASGVYLLTVALDSAIFSEKLVLK